jgi:hypothetical protein
MVNTMATGSTTNYDIPYPLSSDPVNVHEDIQSLAETVESLLGTIGPAYHTLEVTNTYILGQNDSFIEIRTKVKNTHASLSLTNLRTWVGTRDDWVGNSDGNIKERGDISTGNFVLSPNQATRSPALRIKSGSEGVLFYSTSYYNKGWKS